MILGWRKILLYFPDAPYMQDVSACIKKISQMHIEKYSIHGSSGFGHGESMIHKVESTENWPIIYSQILSTTNDCTVDIVILLSCEYFPKPFFNHFGRLPKIQATHFGRLTCPGDYPYLPNPLQKSPPAVLSPWLPPGSSPSANHSEARKSWSLQWLLDSLP